MKRKRCFTLEFLISLVIATTTLLVFHPRMAYADYAEDLMEKTMDFTKIQEEAGQQYLIKPVSKITIEDFYYSNNAKRRYCFENSEGRCIDQQNNAIATIEGKGRYEDRFYVYYKTERTEEGQLRLKKAYGLLRMGIWSLEYGKDTIWVGPGYHGSFLLSNNAEGFMVFRLRTEEPFRLPWIFSNLGEFKYDIFKGWSENFSLIGQTLKWRPIPLLEFGANEVVSIFPGYHYSIGQYPKLFIPQYYGYYDQNGNWFTPTKLKSSIDVILDMPFLSKVSPFVNGKLYYEYAGNDSFSYYQSLGRHWIWPLGFDYLNIAWMTGLFLTTGNVDYRFEYAQNYVSYPLFYDYYKRPSIGTGIRRQGYWYTDPINTRYGLITGHEMGNDSDDYYFEVNLRRNPASLKVYYDQERHGLSANVSYPPEKRYEYGLRPAYQIRNYTLFADLIYNHYKNVNYSTNPVQYDIHPGTELDEFIAGLGVEIGF